VDDRVGLPQFAGMFVNTSSLKVMADKGKKWHEEIMHVHMKMVGWPKENEDKKRALYFTCLKAHRCLAQ
jgi:hypothetical protein